MVLRLKIASQENRSRNTIDDAFAFLSTDIGGDQQLFRRFSRHSLVPPDDRHGQARFQFYCKLAHRLDGRPFPSIQLKRQSQHHLLDIV